MKRLFLYHPCRTMEWLWFLGLLKIPAAFCIIALTYMHFWFWSAFSYFEADPLAAYDFIVSKFFFSLFTTGRRKIWLFALLHSTNFPQVGAGSSGSVLSSRLSENGSYSVLLLEAGGYPNSFAEIPLASGILPSTPLSWSYQTEPQEVGFGATVEKVNHGNVN